jgi:hypothetical protein
VAKIENTLNENYNFYHIFHLQTIYINSILKAYRLPRNKSVILLLVF